LYEALPQSKVESLLLPFLQDPDPDVRTNVLIALGMPSYKMGFAPGKPLLSRSERLEPVSIQPTSLRTVLTVLKQETNQRVMDNLVCLLSSQTFEGKLRPHAGEVYVVVRELMSKLKSRQSVKDCAEIMAGLPFDGDRG
jgi:hypothetical protein